MRSSSLVRTLLPSAAVLAGLLVFVSAAMAALGDRTLRQGMSGDDVMQLQRLVTELGYPTPRSGAFTSRTKSDITGYERTTGLTVNGEVDPSEGKTIVRRAQERRDRMNGGSGGGSTRRYHFGERPLYEGRRGGDVMTLQRLVTELGYPTPRYGLFTRRTKRDMLHYERSTGLQVNGVVSLTEQRAIARRAGHGESSRDHVFPIRGPHSYGGSGSRFGAPRSGRRHGGQDLAAASGTPLVAVTNGRVSQVRYQAGAAGYYVVIQGDDRYDYVYMHMRESASAWVSPGQRVRVGQQIGRVGSTGGSTGPHLHFEMWTAHWFDGGHRIDPLAALKRWDAYS